MEDLRSLMSNEWPDMAKISKYTEIQCKKLERAFALRRKGVTKDERVLHYVLKELRNWVIGFEFGRKTQRIIARLFVLDKLVPGMINTGVLQRSTGRTDPDHYYEIAELLRVFEDKINELIQLFQEERKIIEELNAIRDLAKKKNLPSIAKYIEYYDKKLELKLKKQNKRFSEDLHQFVQGDRIHEDSYGSIGRIYEIENQKKLNGKGVIIFSGTTLHFRQYEPLSYRFALEGYTVLALNLPAHGVDMSFRLGNGSVLLAQAVRDLRNICSKVGVVGFSLGGLCAMYSLFSFDYAFEKLLKKKLGDFVSLLNEGRVNELKGLYQELKSLVHQSVLRAFGAYYKGGVGLVGQKHGRGIPDAVIFAGMPISLYRSKKLFAPSIFIATFDWMRFTTSALVNTPPTRIRRLFQPEIVRKMINGFERHHPIEEPEYKDKKSVYIKFFRFKSSKDLKAIKTYVHDLTKDPEMVLALLDKNKEAGPYLDYYLRRVREIPKFFMYGEKDALSMGGGFKDYFASAFNKKPSISYESVKHIVLALTGSSKVRPKFYPNLGHTLDEKKGNMKKLSRRPQDIQVQNDMVGFMKRYL